MAYFNFRPFQVLPRNASYSRRHRLASAARKGGLLVIFGRRRVGKSRMLRHWIAMNGGMYSQAIEGPQDMQIRRVFEDIKGRLGTQITPKTWAELLEVLSLQKKP